MLGRNLLIVLKLRRGVDCQHLNIGIVNNLYRNLLWIKRTRDRNHANDREQSHEYE